MRKTSIGVLLILGGPLLFATQQQKGTAGVTLLEARGVPGETRPVPMQLAIGDGVEVGALAATIRFPAKLVTFEKLEAGFTVTEVHLKLVAKIPGADKAAFETAANNAKTGCPISRLLNTKITLDAQLIS